jgi:hypothetical protein
MVVAQCNAEKPVTCKVMRRPFKSRSLAENTALLSQESNGPHGQLL